MTTEADTAAWAGVAADSIRSRMSQEVRWQGLGRGTESLTVPQAVLEEGARQGMLPGLQEWLEGEWQILVAGNGEAAARCWQ